MIQLNYRDSKPIYEQIKDGLRKLVISNSLSADEKLPSVRELAAKLAINPNTIQRAYGELERRGVIYAAKGRGNFISDNMTVLRERRLEEIGAQIGALAAQARTLGADEDRLRGWLQKKGVDRA